METQDNFNPNDPALIFSTKRILTAKEAAMFLDVKLTYLYKLVETRKVPVCCPFGKKIYFDKNELEQMILASRQAPDSEITAQAEAFCRKPLPL